MAYALDSVKRILQGILEKLRKNESISEDILISMREIIIQIGEIHNEICQLENEE